MYQENNNSALKQSKNKHVEVIFDTDKILISNEKEKLREVKRGLCLEFLNENNAVLNIKDAKDEDLINAMQIIYAVCKDREIIK